ncbi:hypothetical protein TNCV_1150051 [Trichonephila clavipes]|nr:hypothetical protein TNCV_1150051 [Trichonephila clavipes]
MFTPLPPETCPVVETSTTISKTIPSAPQAAKQASRNRYIRRGHACYDVQDVESPKNNNSLGKVKKLSEEWWQTEA